MLLVQNDSTQSDTGQQRTKLPSTKYLANGAIFKLPVIWYTELCRLLVNENSEMEKTWFIVVASYIGYIIVF